MVEADVRLLMLEACSHGRLRLSWQPHFRSLVLIIVNRSSAPKGFSQSKFVPEVHSGIKGVC